MSFVVTISIHTRCVHGSRLISSRPSSSVPPEVEAAQFNFSLSDDEVASLLDIHNQFGLLSAVTTVQPVVLVESMNDAGGRKRRENASFRRLTIYDLETSDAGVPPRASKRGRGEISLKRGYFLPGQDYLSIAAVVENSRADG